VAAGGVAFLRLDLFEQAVGVGAAAVGGGHLV
jgi:hypothetical protein